MIKVKYFFNFSQKIHIHTSCKNYGIICALKKTCNAMRKGTIMNEKKHELLPDVLRGFAILLMVFGHCIQAGSGAAFRDNALYFQDKLYQFIYSFHMPLFMLISGYFAHQSMERAKEKKERLSLLKRRSLSLLSPILFWTVFELLYAYISNIIKGYPNQPFFGIVIEFVKKLLTNCWFLWAVFWCFLLVYLMHYYLKDSALLYLLGLLSFFVLPDGMNLGVYKFSAIYYVAAFYFAGYLKKKDNPLLEKLSYLKILYIYTLLLGIIFIVLFSLYNAQCFIYTTGFHFIGKNVTLQIGIDIYRIIIGFVGSCFFILFAKLLLVLLPNYRFHLLSLMGSNSMGIYLISGYVLLFGAVRITDSLEPSYLLNLVTCISVVIISTLLTLILKRIPWLSWTIGKPHKK